MTIKAIILAKLNGSFVITAWNLLPNLLQFFERFTLRFGNHSVDEKDGNHAEKPKNEVGE